MKLERLAGCLIASIMGGIAASFGATASPASVDLVVSPSKLPRIARVDPRYQSYNVEMAEVIGGNFWKPYTPASVAAMKAKAAQASSTASVGVAGQDKTMFEKRAPIDLSNPRLRVLAKALGPACVRVSGTWANSAWFDASDQPPLEKAPSGFNGVLTRAEWKGVVDFAHAVNAELVTSFAISAGVRNAQDVWTPTQARKLVDYTHSIGGHIAAAEF
ncbi:MAG: hypothetical protein EPN40_08240, partial [Rhodanobacteraceae bacterium]